MIFDIINFSFLNLKRRKTRSYLTMIGIFIGIAAVVSLIGLGEGLRLAIIGQFGFLGTDVLSVQAKGLNMMGPPGTGASNPLDVRYVSQIERLSGVDSAFPRFFGAAQVEFKDQFFIGFIQSVPEGSKRKSFETIINLKTIEGRLLRDGDNNRVLLGYSFQKNNDNKNGLNTGDKIKINDKTYNVVGILEKKGSFIIDGGIFLNEEEITRVLNNNQNPNIIAIRVKDQNNINQVKEEVEKILRKERRVKVGEEDFTISTPQSSLDSLNSTLFAVQLFVIIIALISLLVGGIGITNTMYTAVLERTKEIGILKSIGAKNSTVFSIFLFESGLLGLVGGIIGILLGMIFAYGLSFLGRLFLGSDLIQAEISLTLILGSLLFSFLIGMLAGFIPAYQASKKHPVDSLRFAK
jgi:putative ABC transport system permease protein